MAGKRHRWRPVTGGGVCEQCPVSYQNRDGAKGGRVVLWILPDGSMREGGATPPCPGRPEEKKP